MKSHKQKPADPEYQLLHPAIHLVLVRLLYFPVKDLYPAAPQVFFHILKAIET